MLLHFSSIFFRIRSANVCLLSLNVGCNLDDVHGCVVDGGDGSTDGAEETSVSSTPSVALSLECNFCSCVHSLVAFEWSHRRKSYAIFEAIFLNPMLVPVRVRTEFIFFQKKKIEK